MHRSFWHRSFWLHALFPASLFSAGNSFGVKTAPARSIPKPSDTHPITAPAKAETQTIVSRSLWFEDDKKTTQLTILERGN